MLDLTYLKNVLAGRLEGVDGDDIIESAAGYDGIVALIQTKDLPTVVVLEHNEVGEFSFRPGGFQKASQSLWVMRMVGRDDSRRAVQDECKTLMKRMLSVFISRKELEDGQLAQWDSGSIPYGIRNAGANYTGYEFTLNFNEDLDLSYDGQTETC